VLDAYTRRAGIAPGLIAAAPAVAVAGAGVLSSDPGIRALALLSTALGIALAALVRSAGRRLEPDLWESWGGSPTVRRLRWRDAERADVIVRLHGRINELLDEALPNQSAEAADPEGADRQYEEAVAVLRERTRDQHRFRLVFSENADYGFRRNSLGIRPFAIGVAALAAGLSLALAIVRGDEWTRWMVACLVSAGAWAYWWRVVTPAWVREAAETYADRLFEAVDTLRRD